MRNLSIGYKTANEVCKDFANKRVQVQVTNSVQLSSFAEDLKKTGFSRFTDLIEDDFDDIVDTIRSKGSATIRLGDDKDCVKWTSKPEKHADYNNAYSYVVLNRESIKKSTSTSAPYSASCSAPVFAATKRTATPSIKSYKKGDSIMKKTTNKLFANLIPAFVTDGSIALSSTGALAVRRQATGDFVRYDAAQGAIVNEENLVLDLGIDKMFILMPSKDVVAGDIVKVDNGYFAVTGITDGNVKGINLNDGTAKTLIPEKNIILGAMNYFVVKNMFGGLTGTSTGADFASNPLMLMALAGNGGDTDLSKMLLFSTLGQGGGDIMSNPMMLMALAGDGDMDMSKMLMFSMLGKGGAGAADTNALLPLMLLGGDGNTDTSKLLMFSMMSGGKGLDFASNPMMAMALLGGDSLGGSDDMTKMLLFSQMAGGTTGAGAIDPMMLMLLGGNSGSDDTMKTFALMQMMQQGATAKPIVDVAAKEVADDKDAQ